MTTFPHPVASPPRASFSVSPVWATAFLLVHVPLILAMRASPAVSTTHALLVLALGLGWAVAGQEERVAAWGAYAAACDVPWRMSHPSVPWEFAKYALVLVFAFAILRSGRLRGPVLPFIYLGLLIPSSLFVVWSLGPREAFNGISFNLSGPLALAVAVWFFSRLMLTASDYAVLLIAMMGPIIGVGSKALFGLFGMRLEEDLAFTGASNFAASGGYGPNQVSALLGLGALLSLLLFVTTRGPGWFRAVLFVLIVGLASQCALTFSRGGLFTAAGAAAAAVPFLVRDRGARRRLLFGGAIALAATVSVVVPGLESFTGGALGARFADLGTTGRDRIAMADLTIWKENPLFGVGPGMGPASRLALYGATAEAHTEWSRLVAEHGLLGLGAVICLVAMALRALAPYRRPLEKALAAALVVWAFLFMLHAGMRLAAPAFAVGLAQCRIGVSAKRTEERQA